MKNLNENTGVITEKYSAIFVKYLINLGHKRILEFQKKKKNFGEILEKSCSFIWKSFEEIVKKKSEKF